MDGTVLVALVSVMMLGVLGVLALMIGGRVRFESRGANKSTKLEIEGGEKGEQ